LANADDACGGDEDGREGEIDYGVMDSARTAGGAGEIESGGVVLAPTCQMAVRNAS